MHDPSEAGRRERLAEIMAEPGQREALEAKYGPIWESQDLNRDFEVLGFLAPYVLVRRRADGVKGTLEFRHQPRFYYGFVPDTSR